MAKEVLLYGGIYSGTATNFIRDIDSASEDEGLELRINTTGGDVLYGWGMIAKYGEYKGEKIAKVDGMAYSMGAAFLLYCDKAEALDVSQFMIHRAGYGEWYEANYMTDSQKANLITVNKNLEKALRSKIDVDYFEKLAGSKIEDLFSIDGREEVFFTAKEAKKMGLIDNIIKITPKKKAEIESMNSRIAAKYIGSENNNENNNQENDNKMSVEEFKNKHPEAYKSIVEEAIKAERDRVGAWAAYIDVDKKAVLEGIKEGKDLSMTTVSEFNVKMNSMATATATEQNNADDIDTDEPDQNPKSEQDKISAQMDKALGLGTK